MKKALLFLPNIITVFRIILTFLFAGMLISGLVRDTTKMPTVIYAVFIWVCFKLRVNDLPDQKFVNTQDCCFLAAG
jgi:phosphatidylglycerophosphate synthase